MTVYTHTPKIMTVSHPTAIEMNSPTDITVFIQNAESQPFENAWVVLYKRGTSGPEVFQCLQADASGIVTFNDVLVPTAGDLKVTVTYHYLDINYVPYQGTIKVCEIMTDDTLALAYNGNRHLAREVGTNNLHITYTDNGHIYYRYSTDYGANWSAREDVGTGSYPCIANPRAITWTNSAGYLYFAKKIGASWQTTLLYQPTQPIDPIVNSPPAMIIDLAARPTKVHILVTTTGRNPGDDNVTHEVWHYYFNFDVPASTKSIIESVSAPASPLRRHSPSIIRNEIDNTLHAAWMRTDTICYARKTPSGSWTKYGNPCAPWSIKSAHPFVESYGDSIYLVWQYKDSPSTPEEIYRAARWRVAYGWSWWLMSNTPPTISLYPVNASGLFTVFTDEASNPMNFDIFFKIRPGDPLTNVSQTPDKSICPQSVARITPSGNYLSTLWLENDEQPYFIKFKENTVIQPLGGGAFLTSLSGDSIMSPYLERRDGYNSKWQIPVDYGYQRLTYSFPLNPAYLYQVKVIAYHEKVSEWRVTLKADGGDQLLIRYDSGIPETLLFWIPQQCYQDSIVKIRIAKVVGDFVAIGPIYVYRYEDELGGDGGPYSSQSSLVNGDRLYLQISPNPIASDFTVTYNLKTALNIKLAVYDVAGKMVKILQNGEQKEGLHREKITGLNLPRGVYFVRLETPGEMMVQKVIFVR